MIKCVEHDVKMIEKFEAQCPAAVRDFLNSDEFWVEVQTRYETDPSKQARAIALFARRQPSP